MGKEGTGKSGAGPRPQPGLSITILDKAMEHPLPAGCEFVGRSSSFQWECILRRVAEWMYAQNIDIQYADYVTVQVDINRDIFVRISSKP